MFAAYSPVDCPRGLEPSIETAKLLCQDGWLFHAQQARDGSELSLGTISELWNLSKGVYLVCGQKLKGTHWAAFNAERGVAVLLR